MPQNAETPMFKPENQSPLLPHEDTRSRPEAPLNNSDSDGSIRKPIQQIASFTQEVSEDGESQRDRLLFENKWEFLFSCVSMSVGLGNFWRFPVTAYKNGGGAFLIPYLIVLIVIGRPIYFMELTLGQFSSYGQVKAWKLSPFFKGVGYGSMISTMAVTTYYVSIISMTAYYFFSSFQSILPWSYCDESWAGEGNCLNGTSAVANKSTSELFFKKEVMKEADNIESGIGAPDLKLTMCLIFAWVVIFGSVIKGVKSSGKVAYFTAIFPYIGMMILLIRGSTLEGALDGIKYFLKPDFKKLLDPTVWYAAVVQCYFSLNTCFGSIIMFSSHNPFNHNIYRDAWIVSLMDTFTSLLAGCTVFAVLGYLADVSGKKIDDVVDDGTGLAFVSYPEVLAKFGWCPQLFAVLFFLMLFTLGLGSSISDVGAIITVFCDKFPKLVRWKVTAVICFFGCAIGVVYTTPGGQFILELVDFYGATFVIYTTSLMEVIGIAWVYGVYNYLDDIEFMLDIKLGWYWKICWGLILPIFLGFILIYSFVVGGLFPTYKDLAYPTSALVCGWLLAFIGLVTLPLGAIQAMSKVPGSIKEKFLGALKPDPGWGPRDAQTRLDWIEFKRSKEQLTLLERIKQRKL